MKTYDFSKGKRGAVSRYLRARSESPSGSTATSSITSAMVERAGGGNYQTVINTYCATILRARSPRPHWRTLCGA